MRKDKPEIIPADKQVRRNWLILIGLYLLILLWLEPLIDFILMQMPLERSFEAIAALNQEKLYVTSIAFGIMRSLPILLFLWFGWQVIQAMRLPPKRMRMPITVQVIKGQKARMMGMMMIAVALLLLLREVNLLINAQPVM
jgi:hypothetical protein